jgi:TatD DNase family protein
MANSEVPVFIDTHAHLDFPEFSSDRDAVLGAAHAAGVAGIINVGASIRTSQEGVALAQRCPRVWAAVGVHPHDADREGESARAHIEPLCREEKVVAVGEIGLDYYKNFSQSANQRALFREMLSLSKAQGLPVVLHSRQAQEDTLAICREFMPFEAVVHCFSGDQDFLEQCLGLGFHVSFTANITYKKAAALRALVAAAPLDRIMLETDCPYLSPEGRRGRRNEPSLVVEVARCVARERRISLEEVAAATTANARRFFRLP